MIEILDIGKKYDHSEAAGNRKRQVTKQTKQSKKERKKSWHKIDYFIC